MKTKINSVLCLLLAGSLCLPVEVTGASLETLVKAAIDNDPWIQGNVALESAIRAEAVAAGELPDPRLTTAFANVPVDTLDFSREPMTQLTVGIVQTFPPGDSRARKRAMLELQGDVNPNQRAARKARLEWQVTAAWVDTCLAHRSIELIEDSRPLFLQLLQVARGNYAQGVRRANQQDLVRAQIEVTRLDERVLNLRQMEERFRQALSEWVPQETLQSAISCEGPRPENEAAGPLVDHPDARALQTHIEVARAALAVARESLRPGWSLNASYGHRQRDQGGNDRSDFVSLGVTVDLPLFRDNRQLKTIEAAASRVEAADSERRLKLNQLQALEREALATHQRLAEQARLYTDTLLPQYVTLTQAALNAYASDQADFADVMRAHIAQLNARVDLVRVESEQAKANAQLKYVRTR